MHYKFIKNAKDLQTTQSDICQGFSSQALQKIDKAAPYIKSAFALRDAINKTKSLDDLLKDEKIYEELSSACGFSDKAKSQLTHEELVFATKRVLKKINDNTKNNFNDEVVFRYLLTKGDSLGGSMRNLTGANAGVKLINLILNNLKKKKISPKIFKSKTSKIQQLSWNNRILLFDIKPSRIGKNIDLILLKSNNKSNINSLLLKDDNYLACGELKGGIDPAGADEHWKTANSALNRIRTALKKQKPHLFFVGAAIEFSMAEEIYEQLNDGRLSHAANLNNEKQVDDLVKWLISL